MTAKNKIILGIDPGVADTGFGLIICDRQCRCLAVGTIKTSKKHSPAKRLLEIHQAIGRIITRYQPDIVAVEKLFFARNVTTALAVGQARGVILLAAQATGKTILEFTPLQIKQAVTGSGQADKRQVGLMVKTLLKLDSVPRPDDAADALAVALCAAGFNPRLTKI